MSQTCYKTIACLLSVTLIVATLILFSAFGDDKYNTKVLVILLEIFILLMICPGGYQDEHSQINDRKLPARTRLARQETLEFSIDLDDSNDDLLSSYKDSIKNCRDNAPERLSDPASNTRAGYSLVHRQSSLPTYMYYP